MWKKCDGMRQCDEHLLKRKVGIDVIERDNVMKYTNKKCLIMQPLHSVTSIHIPSTLPHSITLIPTLPHSITFLPHSITFRFTSPTPHLPYVPLSAR